MIAVELVPKKWGEIAFQSHITDFLQSKIKNNKPPKGVILLGPSGRGKTSIANLLAASIVCPDRDKEGNPCGVCDSCLDIFEDSLSRGVRRVNGEAESSVDDHREIMRGLQQSSLFSDKRVVMIEEAHGLSREALDIYLVPLETPREDKVFYIMTTTESLKLKETIKSRCYSFTMRNPTVMEVTKYLYSVLKYKKVEAPKEFVEEGLVFLSQWSGGNIRQAVNTLEIVLETKNFSKENLESLTSGVSEGNLDSAFIKACKGDSSWVSEMESIIESSSPQSFVGILSYRSLDILKSKKGIVPKYYAGKAFVETINKITDGGFSERFADAMEELKKLNYPNKNDIISNLIRKVFK